VDPTRLLREEDEAWARFAAVRERIPPDRLDDPSVTPGGWSPKDTLHHVAAWLELCADVCEGIAAGTWDPAAEAEETSDLVDRRNAEQFARARAMATSEVEAGLARARDRARRAFAALSEVTPDAWGWFEESGPMHYAKHLHDLSAFTAGVSPDPEVGPLLQAETDAWLALALLLDRIPPERRTEPGPDGWSPHDITHHLASWLDLSARAVAEDRYWYDGEVPAPDAVIDAMNTRFLAEGATVNPEAARDALERGRARMRRALASLVAPSAEAKRTFVLNTTEHYGEHAAALERCLPDGV
jgi:hypothetical protein